MRVRRRLRRACRALAGTVVAVAVVGGLALATDASAGAEPALQREPLPFEATVAYYAIDPQQVALDAAVAGQDDPQCESGGASRNGCQATISELVHQRGAALGVTANFSDGMHILGLAVIDHRQYSPADPHTTTLCIGDPPAPGQRPPVAIGKDADATRCRTAVSGERVVGNGAPSIEGLADDGLPGRFWWSVEHFRRVERTLVGLRADGTLLVAVATAARGGVRNGMTLPAAAAWLIGHGVRDAIALDGGHQADIWSAQHGSLVPLERGEPSMQMSLLLGSGPPVVAPPGPLPATVPAPPAAPTTATRVAEPPSQLRVDGVILDGGAARRVLADQVGAAAMPETGLPDGGEVHLRWEIDGDSPADLDSRWLAAAGAGRRLPDLDQPSAPPALPDTGVVGSAP